MKLKARLDSLEGIDEKFHELYHEVNGQYVLEAIEGLRQQEDVDRLQEALRKERNDHKKLREQYRPLGDRSVDEVIQELERIDEYRLAAEGKVDDKKLNDLVESRIKSRVAPLEREKQSLTAKLHELEGVVTQYQAEKLRRRIADEVQAAIRKSPGFTQTAIEDALMYAERVFQVDETDRVVTKEGCGVTPGVDPAVWLTDMQPKRPHWWGTTTGGGATGGRATSVANNPWSKESWNLTEQGRIYRENPTRAQQLAKAAGKEIL